MPQVPQFALSLLRLTQAPLQMSGMLEGHAHAPAVHVAPVGHLVPHAPQLPVSVFRSAQVPLQSVLPVPHTQAPAVHVLSVAQAVPHVPQFALSLEVSTQTPGAEPHVVVLGAGQEHLPAVHVPPVAQAVPQAPQFAGSVLVSTHAVPHSVLGAAQVVASPSSMVLSVVSPGAVSALVSVPPSVATASPSPVLVSSPPGGSTTSSLPPQPIDPASAVKTNSWLAQPSKDLLRIVALLGIRPVLPQKGTRGRACASGAIRFFSKSFGGRTCDIGQTAVNRPSSSRPCVASSPRGRRPRRAWRWTIGCRRDR